jgi:hypothetical protein
MALPLNSSADVDFHDRHDANSASLARREFLVGAVAATAAVGAALDASHLVRAEEHLSTASRRRRTLADLECDDFRALLGQSFTFSEAGGDDAGTLVVQDVTDLRRAGDSARPHGVRQSGFAVTFVAPAARPGGEGLYELRHRDFATCCLFLQPSSSTFTAGAGLYHAIFN